MITYFLLFSIVILLWCQLSMLVTVFVRLYRYISNTSKFVGETTDMFHLMFGSWVMVSDMLGVWHKLRWDAHSPWHYNQMKNSNKGEFFCQ